MSALRTVTVVLDDDIHVVNMLSRVCEQEGHIVRGFTRAADALGWLAREPVDMLITDMCMPDTDGMVATESAWRLRPDLYVMIITGHAGMFPVENLLTGGHADIMFKPFRMHEFRARLDLALRRRELVARISEEARALHEVANERIQELQRELQRQSRTKPKAQTPEPARTESPEAAADSEEPKA